MYQDNKIISFELQRKIGKEEGWTTSLHISLQLTRSHLSLLTWTSLDTTQHSSSTASVDRLHLFWVILKSTIVFFSKSTHVLWAWPPCVAISRDMEWVPSSASGLLHRHFISGFISKDCINKSWSLHKNVTLHASKKESRSVQMLPSKAWLTSSRLKLRQEMWAQGSLFCISASKLLVGGNFYWLRKALRPCSASSFGMVRPALDRITRYLWSSHLNTWEDSIGIKKKNKI